MSIKSKVFAAAATLTLVGGVGAAGAMSASGATTLTPVAVVNATAALFVVALFAAATSTSRRGGPLLLSTGRRAGLPPSCLSPGRVPAGPGRRTVQAGWSDEPR